MVRLSTCKQPFKYTDDDRSIEAALGACDGLQTRLKQLNNIKLVEVMMDGTEIYHPDDQYMTNWREEQTVRFLDLPLGHVYDAAPILVDMCIGRPSWRQTK